MLFCFSTTEQSAIFFKTFDCNSKIMINNKITANTNYKYKHVTTHKYCIQPLKYFPAAILIDRYSLLSAKGN